MLKKTALKPRKQFFILNAGCFPFDTLFTTGTNSEDIEKYLKKEFNYDLDKEEKEILSELKQGKMIRLRNNAHVLWVRSPAPSLIAHEVFHIVCSILYKVDTPLKDSTEEVYAYLTEHLTKQIYQKLK